MGNAFSTSSLPSPVQNRDKVYYDSVCSLCQKRYAGEPDHPNESVDVVTMVQCKHTMHEACHDQWLVEQIACFANRTTLKSCPVCHHLNHSEKNPDAPAYYNRTIRWSTREKIELKKAKGLTC